MTLVGTVVNGVIVPDEGAGLPEGARVRFELADARDPLAPLDAEAELQLLRARVADLRSGAPGVPLDQALAQIAADAARCPEVTEPVTFRNADCCNTFTS